MNNQERPQYNEVKYYFFYLEQLKGINNQFIEYNVFYCLVCYGCDAVDLYSHFLVLFLAGKQGIPSEKC